MHAASLEHADLKGTRRGRWPGILLVVILGLLLPPDRVDALDPALDVSQYAHTAWKIRDGFYKGTIHAIAQTPDGYLWLGTEFGLLRFDGVRMVPWRSPRNEDLPNGRIQSLLTTRDGRLWIGTDGGLASWKDGKLTLYPALVGQEVPTLLEDREGTVWVGVAAIPTGRLCEVHGSSVRCYGEDGRLGHGVKSLHQDNAGNLWVGAEDGLWRWHPGPPKLYPMPGWVNSVSESDNGALLISLRTGMRTLVGGRAEAYPLPGSWIPDRLFRDRDGGLWVVMQTGLMHIHQGRMDVFTPSDGLSGPNVSALFEDREGSIWVATTDGLDRFRAQAVVTISAKQGLADANHVSTVLGAKDGSVWVGNFVGLSRWDHGQITIYRPQGSTQARELVEKVGLVHDVADSGLPSGGGQSLFQDDRGRIWVITPGGIAYFENGRFTRVKGVPGGGVHSSMAEDGAFNLWISNNDGLFRLRDESVVEKIPWVSLGRNDFAVSLTADPVQGGLWLGFSKSGVAYLKDAQIVASYADGDGLGKGRVNGFRVDPDGALWAATEGGLSRIKEGHIATLTSKNGLPCNNVDWVMEDDEQSFWLNMDCALVRIPRVELDSWVEDARRTVQTMVFDSSDGVRSHAFYGGGSPRVGKSADGKIWFSTFDGLSVIDPRHLPVNKLPPPVHVEKIIVDDKAYDVFPGLRLPPRIHQVEIDYTALSFVAPEKVHFRFKLEGEDHEWQEVGTRRQAFYTNLSPGNYRFRVVASNNSGVWNEAGAALEFSIAPAYYQTRWFAALVIVGTATLLWAAYQLRMRQVARQFNRTLEARLSERTRIARDLHDTLLQSFHGLLLRFQTVSYLLPERPAQAKERLDGAIEHAANAITEGRDAVQGLRASTVEGNDLAVAIRTLGDELVTDTSAQPAPTFSVAIEGQPSDLHPIVRDEIYKIAAEALRNAFRHAHARRVEVDIRYDDEQFRLRVRDDGRGIDPKLLGNQGREGHFGLRGMPERAALIGGKLAVWSEVGAGTEVELRLPARIVYATSRRLSWWSRLVDSKTAARVGGDRS